MLGEGDQMLCMEYKVQQQTYFIVGTPGNPTREGKIDPFLKGRAYLTFVEKMV